MPNPLVLIVDDVPMNVQLLGEALAHDYRVRVATRGADALAIARGAEKPDIILLDIMMPGMDGYEICKRLQDDPATQRIPIIFVTARGDADEEEKGLDLGAVDYIAKPYRIPIVKARLRNHLRLKRQADLLESLAMIDGLTSIPNRRRFDEVMEVEWRRARREGGPFTVLMADIDCFKAFNDRYGHGMGDLCLTQVARALEAAINRPGDLVARYGGEEFGAVLPNTDTEGARHLAERFRRAVAALAIPHADSTAAPHVSVSVGFATARCIEGMSPCDPLRSADRRLYDAKNLGRNRVEGGDCACNGSEP